MIITPNMCTEDRGADIVVKKALDNGAFLVPRGITAM